MKYISVLIFLLAMHWTWGLAYHERPISERVHIDIQTDIKKILTEYIDQNVPNSKDLRFEKFWTEPLNDNQIKVSFIYSFDDSAEQTGEARVKIDGHVTLTRRPEPGSTEWTYEEWIIENNQVDFKDALQISPNQTQKQPASDETKQ